jgi:hypothetical protein
MSHSDPDATSAAELFDLLGESLADMLGTAAAATPRATSQTSWSEPGVVVRFRKCEAGFDAQLVRPVRYEDLTRVLGRAAGGNG